MKLLLDANLSWRLRKMLSHDFSEVYHADYVDLSLPASDIDIWNWAKEQNAVIVTNDEDFFHLLLQKGFPPSIVLLRIGNQSTQRTAEVLINRKVDIEQLHESKDYGLLEIL